MLSLTVIMHGIRFMAQRSRVNQTQRRTGFPVNPAASVKYSWLSYTTGKVPSHKAGAKVSKSLHQMASMRCLCSRNHRLNCTCNDA